MLNKRLNEKLKLRKTKEIKTTITVSIDKNKKEELKILAKNNAVSLNFLMNCIIDDFFDKWK